MSGLLIQTNEYRDVTPTLAEAIKAQGFPENRNVQADAGMLLKNSEIIKAFDNNIPVIPKPRNLIMPDTKKLTPQARLTYLFSSIVELTSGDAQHQIIAKSETAKRYAESAQVYYTASASEYNHTVDILDFFISRVPAETADSDLLSGEASYLRDFFQQESDRLTLERNQTTPGSSEYQNLSDEIDHSNTIVQTANTLLSVDPESSGLAVLNTVSSTVNHAYAVMQSAQLSLPVAAKISERDSMLSSAGRFVQVIASVLKLINDANLEHIELEAASFKEIHEARLMEMQEQAKEIAKKQRLAKLLGKLLGVVGALLGVVLGVATALSGGSLGVVTAGAIAAIVSAAEFISILAADFSLLGKAFEGIKNGISWLIQHMQGLVLELILKSCGTSEEKAEEVNKIYSDVMATITTIVLALGVGLLIGGGGASTASNISKEIVQTALKARIVALVGKMVLEATLSISSGAVEYTSTTMQADMKIIENEIEQLQKARERAMEINQASWEALASLTDLVLETLKHRTESQSKAMVI